VPNKRVNLTRPTVSVVTWDVSPRRLRAVRWTEQRWGDALMFRRMFLVLAVVAATLGAGGCSGRVGEAHGQLDYSVVPRSGGLTATITNGRADERTAWLIVSDSRGRQLSVLSSYGEVGDDPRVTETGSADMKLDPGTYRYAVYDAPGRLGVDGEGFWTAEHRLASGKVEVQ
jgi:hypothetical protein